MTSLAHFKRVNTNNYNSKQSNIIIIQGELPIQSLATTTTTNNNNDNNNNDNNDDNNIDNIRNFHYYDQASTPITDIIVILTS